MKGFYPQFNADKNKYPQRELIAVSLHHQNPNAVQHQPLSPHVSTAPRPSSAHLHPTGKVSLRTRPMSSFMLLWPHLTPGAALSLTGWTKILDYLFTSWSVLSQLLLNKGTEFVPAMDASSTNFIRNYIALKVRDKDKTVTNHLLIVKNRNTSQTRKVKIGYFQQEKVIEHD